MNQHLIPHGDQFLLPIDHSLLDRLRATPETRFELFSDGERLILIPVRGTTKDADFQKALADTRQQFGEAMQPVPED